jgi:uncharacterized radical SAM superfamily Fe-S cluster-containing enzyme
MNKILSHTESVCPECLARIPAARVQRDDDVILEKTCPQHGEFHTIIWRGAESFKAWARPKIPSFPKNPITEIKDGCPYDCGLCAEHRQHTCSVLLEVTQRCDLHCPVCFADAGNADSTDWTMAEVEAWFKHLRAESPSANIQLSGGEPCVRDEHNLGVVLVPTLIPDVNVDDIGNIIRLAKQHIPTVRGVHFQPISYFGRYPESPADKSRVTIPEILREIESQTNGMIRADIFCPPGCENALCSFHGNFVFMPNGDLKPITQHKEDSCGCKPIIAEEGAARTRTFVAENWSAPKLISDLPVFSNSPSLGEWDVFLERKRTHSFFISGMAFQDAWNLDLERLRDCCIHVAAPDGRLIPFCAYNLTDKDGKSLYRNTESKVWRLSTLQSLETLESSAK